MDINKVKMMISGSWRFDDGRIIEFFSNDHYLIKDENGKPFYDEKPRIFYNTTEEGDVIISMPLLPEPMARLDLLSQEELIYVSYDIDGSKEKITLTKVQ